MQANLTVTFDDAERIIFSAVESPSILAGPEKDEKGPHPRSRLVRRASRGEALNSSELAALVGVLGAAIKDRRANIVIALDMGSADLASAFETWLDPLDVALRLACRAQAFGITGDAAARVLSEAQAAREEKLAAAVEPA